MHLVEKLLIDGFRKWDNGVRELRGLPNKAPIVHDNSKYAFAIAYAVSKLTFRALVLNPDGNRYIYIKTFSYPAAIKIDITEPVEYVNLVANKLRLSGYRISCGTVTSEWMLGLRISTNLFSKLCHLIPLLSKILYYDPDLKAKQCPNCGSSTLNLKYCNTCLLALPYKAVKYYFSNNYVLPDNIEYDDSSLNTVNNNCYAVLSLRSPLEYREQTRKYGWNCMLCNRPIFRSYIPNICDNCFINSINGIELELDLANGLTSLDLECVNKYRVK